MPLGKSYDEFLEEQKNKGLTDERIIVKDYLYDMPLYMSAADIVVCRAGAMTLSELSMIGMPAILIPSPNVTDDHQYKNAKVIADKGGAILFREEENTPALTSDAIKKIYDDPEELVGMSEGIKSFARPDASKRIYEEIERLLSYKRKVAK